MPCKENGKVGRGFETLDWRRVREITYVGYEPSEDLSEAVLSSKFSSRHILFDDLCPFISPSHRTMIFSYTTEQEHKH